MIVLVIATAELALVAALGSWTKWLIIHGAIATIALIIFLTKISRGLGGLLGGRGKGLGGLLGKHGPGRGLGGLLGGRGRGTGGGLGGRGRGLGGLLGGRGRGTGGGLGGLLGKHGTGRGIGGHGRGHGLGGNSTGKGRGLGGLLGGRGHGTGHGTGRGTGGGLGGLFGGRGTGSGPGTRSTGSTPNRGNGSKDHPTKDHDNDDKDQPGLLARAAEELKRGWDAAGPKTKEKPEGETEPDDDTPEDTEEETTPDKKTDDKPTEKPAEQPAPPQGGSRKMVKTHGTPSLQAWGRCLPTVEAALLEKQREVRRIEADLENIAEAVTRLHNQGEQELPASPRLVALLSDIQASLNRLPRVSEVLGRIASNANALAPLYRTEHSNDEDRLSGMRGGVDREKRSDVGTAQQDT